MFRRVVTGLSCLILGMLNLSGQSYDVFSIAGNKLLRVNPVDAAVLESFTIAGLPEGESIRSLTYVASEDAMFGLIGIADLPTLVRLSPEGTLSIVGNIRVSNETVFLAEGLAYNETDDKLYAAVSLNGGTADNDFFSETLIEIDPATAQANVAAQISFPTGTPDVDNMTFDNNVLIIHDGLPGDDENRFYLIDFGTITGGTAAATLGFSVSPYVPVGDIEKLNCSNTLLIVQEYELLRLDIDQQQLSLIGSTHDMGQFDGAILSALTDAPGKQALPLSVSQDTTACEGEVVDLFLTGQSLTVDWNTGESAASISVMEGGAYFGTVEINGCQVPTDTINIAFESCENCEDLGSDLAASLTLGGDTVVCTGGSLPLFIDIDNATVTWSTGLMGANLEVMEEGLYWATVMVGACIFQTDTISVQFNSCDGCDALGLELSDQLMLGNDTTICANDTIGIVLDIPGADIQWNTGQTGSGILVNVPGAYWAEVSLGGCVFPSDTIGVGTTDCLECNIYIPNVFSPDGNDVNDHFQVFVDESTCRLQEIEIHIFNRWGRLVYESRQNRWDGRFNNEMAQSGLYVYLIKMTLVREGVPFELMKSGDVMLLTNE